ncbi:hypothetical protein QN277_001733 [Acacia crassicarpa]|uniref:Thylakoid membrane protein TERC, chloroplastic n=1 Tax=Acacia crassicarpa TaxID=499986 RepID=A0AAE1THC7_9FABA|nr:hypothetical protein QN277_001733 [Acacia crassicarpa]
MSPGLVTHVLSCLRRSPCSSLMLPLKYRSAFLVRSCLSAGLISIGDQVSASVPGSSSFIAHTCSHLPTSGVLRRVPALKWPAIHSYLCPRAYCAPFSCSKGTDDDDNKKINDHHPHEEDNIVDNKSYVSSSSDNEANYMSSVRRFTFWVSATITFDIGVGFIEGIDKASEFFTGYILEQLLSADNLCVFILIFKYFKVPKKHQNRVLSYGIAGAIFFRLTFILLGSATLQKFEVLNLGLASILLYSSFKLFHSDDEEEEEDKKSDLSDNLVVKTCKRLIPVTTFYDGNRFITNQNGVWKATPLLLSVAVIEVSDIAFAVDSVSAVFGVTRDPFIVFSSNLFAIMSLRSLYSVISKVMSDLKYLQPSVAVVLGFFGCKMILMDYFGIIHVSTVTSLGFVASSLTIGVLLSVLKKSKKLG